MPRVHEYMQDTLPRPAAARRVIETPSPGHPAQEIAGAALPMSAEAIMESFDWVASAWKGRIAELVGAQDYAEA